jgi:hypothetical protein
MQRMVRSKLTSGGGAVRLHCKILSERLIFESELCYGLFRLGNQIGIFGLLLLALAYSSDPSAQRGIYNNLSEIVVVACRRICLNCGYGAYPTTNTQKYICILC